MAWHEQYEIEHNGMKMLVRADCYGPDPDVGIFGCYSEGHGILDPETEDQIHPDIEATLSEEDWQSIAVKFDDLLSDEPAEFFS